MTVREPIAEDVVDEALDRLALFLMLNSNREDPETASEAFATLLGLKGPGLHKLADRMDQFVHPQEIGACMFGVVMGMLIAEQERWEES